jgi:aryl-alcohol dehydrogenase-like predicted oxidoreductase
MTSSEDRIAKIGLGTVQFGLDYGLTNPNCRVPTAEVERILGRAATLGIKVLDTAALYGVSEETLGRILGPEHPFHIVTKTDKAEGDRITDADTDNVVRTFDRSLTRLGQEAVFGLLVHDADDLLKPGGRRLIDALGQLKSERRVSKIGVSVYTGDQLDGVLEVFTPDLVQLPVNVLDQRLISGGQLERLHRLGVEVHARSVLLQGLLLTEPQSLDRYFDPVRSHLEDYWDGITQIGATPLEGALQFALGQPQIDTVVVGVCSRHELEEIRRASLHPGMPSIDFRRWAVDDPHYVNPSLWRLHERAPLLGR